MKNWIGGLHKGGLHESLNVPEGKKIPGSLMGQAIAGKKGKLAQKQAIAARTLKKLRPK